MLDSAHVVAKQALTAARLDELQVQARFARQRYDLYKARAYGERPTSPARLRELQRESERAEAALRFAKSEAIGVSLDAAQLPAT